MYSMSVSAVVPADASTVYAALLDPDAVARWRVPDGMTGEVHELDARVGGRVRMSLTYDDPGAAGKTEGATDTYAGRLVELVDGERVVEEIEFDSDDPGLAGLIMITTTLRPAPEGGTEVEMRFDGMPDSVPADQNELGTRMSLSKLARLVGP
ncbi:SRPBCC domain-containing protein [Nocardioides sp. YIM 152315]|uniref:SRPBCC domain-containing protein n=1 Tax=Nocardioides sp. YIM 152315 TaxID=3031760 RepID=UPI0023D9D7E0|nr:SRPBCC domain-containing protein [Nocardioides sp. YIM 152315]MDF1603948.1 SRPBCC domain-containing protein [Nocardioides sp. YIM 152315]